MIAAIILSSSALYARAEEENYAPQKGKFSTEIQFNPFGEDGVFSNGGEFRGAYMVSNKTALIFGVGLQGADSKVVNFDDDNLADGFVRTYSGQVSIDLGFRYYFYNYKRINIYFGAEAAYIHQFAGEKLFQDNRNWTWSNAGTGNGFGLAVNTGIDFYIYHGLYVGAEINLNYADVLLNGYTYKAVLNGERINEKLKAGGHIAAGGFDINPMIRLGWSF